MPGCGGYHPRSPLGHSWSGKTDSGGLLPEEALYIRRGDVAFNEVVTDFGCMAGAVAVRHAKGFAGSRYILHIVGHDFETGSAHVLDPLFAAAAIGAFINVHMARGEGIDGAGSHQGYRQEGGAKRGMESHGDGP